MQKIHYFYQLPPQLLDDLTTVVSMLRKGKSLENIAVGTHLRNYLNIHKVI